MREKRFSFKNLYCYQSIIPYMLFSANLWDMRLCLLCFVAEYNNNFVNAKASNNNIAVAKISLQQERKWIAKTWTMNKIKDNYLLVKISYKRGKSLWWNPGGFSGFLNWSFVLSVVRFFWSDSLLSFVVTCFEHVILFGMFKMWHPNIIFFSSSRSGPEISRILCFPS